MESEQIVLRRQIRKKLGRVARRRNYSDTPHPPSLGGEGDHRIRAGGAGPKSSRG